MLSEKLLHLNANKSLAKYDINPEDIVAKYLVSWLLTMDGSSSEINTVYLNFSGVES